MSTNRAKSAEFCECGKRANRIYKKKVQGGYTILRNCEVCNISWYVNYCWNCRSSIDGRYLQRCQDPECRYFYCGSCGVCSPLCISKRIEIAKVELRQKNHLSPTLTPKKELSDQEKKWQSAVDSVWNTRLPDDPLELEQFREDHYGIYVIDDDGEPCLIGYSDEE